MLLLSQLLVHQTEDTVHMPCILTSDLLIQFSFISVSLFCVLLQMSSTHLIKHTPASAASTATDQNAQITFPIGPLGKEHIRVLGGQTNHCMAHTKHSGAHGGPGTGSLNPCPPASPGNSEEDDGGGGTRVKKKRKKKDKRDSGTWKKPERERESESKPKKKKELKELKEILPRKSKAPKELKEVKESKKFKELKSPKEPRKGRKGREAKPKPKPKPAVDCKATLSPPRQRGRKPK